MRPHVAEAVERELAARPRGTAPDWDHLTLRRGVLSTPGGDVPVEEIGGGAFATVYRERGGRGRVFALTDDDVYDKEVYEYARDADHPNPHVPAVERFGYTSSPPGKRVFTMPYYKAPLRKGNGAQAWRDYRALKACWDDTRGPAGYEKNQRVIDCMRAAPGVTPGVVEALVDLAGAAADYSTEYTFEVAPRNLATDAEGRLVLLDVLFDPPVLARKRRESAERAMRGRRR